MDDDKNGTAKVWLQRLTDAEEREYHNVADRIDTLYSDLRKLSAVRKDRQYQLFWANLGVLLPTLYSRAPIPVATSRFQDRKELPRRAADILERALMADVERDKLHDTMLLIRDDLGIAGRGVPWLRLKDRDGLTVPCTAHVNRKDFRCDQARYWYEVTWVAKQAWLTKAEVKKRFGEVAEGMVFSEDKPDRKADQKGPSKASIWEIWDKTTRKLYFVSEGVKDIIETAEPPMDLEDFFPCPRPAWSTVQRGTLTPVPDMVYYKDQLEEINELTARIGGLQKALRLKGFYSAGHDGLGEAVEQIMRRTDNEAILVPVSSFAMGAGGKAGDAVLWLPLSDIAAALRECVELRRHHIEDVYEITGISDIMRGQTDSQETLGAQEMKSQIGAVRIRERQLELVRIARDIICMKAEVMAETIPIQDLLTMAQVDDLPTAADIQQQVQQIIQQAQQAMVPLMEADPAEAQGQFQEIEQQVQQAIEQAQAQVTVEAVEQLLKSQKIRPFVLDIETDSTIQPDENAEKQKRVEFMGALGPLLQQGVMAMQMAPQLGPFVAESIRFVASGFRAGRRMDDAIDQLAEGFANYQPAPQESGEDPQAAQMMAQAEMVKAQATGEMAQAKAQEAQAKVQQMQADVQTSQQEAQLDAQKTTVEIEKLQAEIQAIMAKIGMEQKKCEIEYEQAQTETALATQKAQVDTALAVRGDAREIEQQQHAVSMQEREFHRSGEHQKAEGKRADMQAKAAVNKTNAQAKAATRKPMNG